MKTPYWFLRKTPLAFILWPVSVLYYWVSKTVAKFRGLHPYKSKRPIICVGNIMAGGVGKTPIVRELAKYFKAPVVMRGYKQDIKSGRIGDEAVMLSEDDILVHTGDRKSNIILLNKQSDKSPIIMDDGLQNTSIYKDISIVVFDEYMGLGNGFLLPAGPLRDRKSSLEKVDVFIVIKSETKKARLELPVDKPIFYASVETLSPYDKKQKLVAFAGIGYPKKFFNKLTNVVATRSFPDHYQYNDKDIEKLMKLAERNHAKLVTTKKDWVRLPEYAKSEIKYAELNMNLDSAIFDWLKGKLK